MPDSACGVTSRGSTWTVRTVAPLWCAACAACAPLPHRDWEEGDAVAAIGTESAGFAPTNATVEQRVDTADRIWRTLVERYYDPGFNGRDVAALRARTVADVRAVANDAAFCEVLIREVCAVARRGAHLRAGRDVVVDAAVAALPATIASFRRAP